jgi:putative peptidoglycan lipid II flippase
VGTGGDPTAEVLTPDETEDRVIEDSFVRHTAVMSAGTALSRVTGFLRLVAISAALGQLTIRANAYGVANNTPNIVYELILGGVLTSVFVPVFVERMTKRTVAAAWESARAMLSIALVVLSAVTAVTIVAAPLIVGIYTHRLGTGPAADAERSLATFFLRWFMPQIVFYGVGAVATGLLNAHRRFAAPMFAPVLNNVIVIGTMIAFMVLPAAPAGDVDGVTRVQAYVLAIGTTLGVVAMTLALVPSLRGTGFRFRWRAAWRDEAVRRIGRLSLWVFLYVATNQLALLTVIVLSLQVGGYAPYVSAFILFQLPHAVYSVSVMTALLPALSTRWTERDREGFAELLSLGLRSTAFIVIPAALGYIALAQPIVFATLRHGATTAAAASLVARILVFFAIGLPFFSAFQLFARAFYGTQNTRAPALINLVATGLNIAGNYLLFPAMGVEGLALAFSLSYVFAALFSYAALRWWIRGIDGRAVGSTILRTTVAAGVAAGVAYGVSWLVGGQAAVAPRFVGQVVQVVLGVTIGGATFVGLAIALRIPEVQLLKRLKPVRRR